MVRTLIMALALCLVAASAHADPTAEDKAACEADYKQYCASVPDKNTSEVVACLKQHIEKLSGQCRKHVEEK